jgi:hypothetical protein
MASDKRAPTTRRTRIVVTSAVLLAIGLIVGLLVALGQSKPAVESSPLAKMLESRFVDANVFIENLGAPAPAGLGRHWETTSVPLLGASSANAHLGRAEHDWLSSSGTPEPLHASELRAILEDQRAVIEELFTGAERSDLLAQLSQVTSGEAQSPPVISSPGGARVRQFYEVSVQGHIAMVRALVDTWVQLDSIDARSGRLRLSTSVEQSRVLSSATFQKTPNGWRIASLNQVPWQQAT